MLYVYFEKKNRTTKEILDYLNKKLKLQRKHIGIAGLKDKTAMTRQWICVYKRLLDQRGGAENFVKTLNNITRIIAYEWHTTPLNLSSPIKNTFHIRLRAAQSVSDEKKKELTEQLEEIFKTGVPNFFGNQRFGVNNRNIEIGRQIMLGELHESDKFEAKFKLKAFSSFLFNQYVKSRTKRSLTLMDGDILSDDHGNYSMYFEKLG